jgi:hypothetical protein
LSHEEEDWLLLHASAVHVSEAWSPQKVGQKGGELENSWDAMSVMW